MEIEIIKHWLVLDNMMLYELLKVMSYTVSFYRVIYHWARELPIYAKLIFLNLQKFVSF